MYFQVLLPDLCKLIAKMKCGARTLTYHDLRKLWVISFGVKQQHFKQLEINRSQSDRYPTSWSVQRGHHFFLWKKVRIHCSLQ